MTNPEDGLLYLTKTTKWTFPTVSGSREQQGCVETWSRGGDMTEVVNISPDCGTTTTTWSGSTWGNGSRVCEADPTLDTSYSCFSSILPDGSAWSGSITNTDYSGSNTEETIWPCVETFDPDPVVTYSNPFEPETTPALIGRVTGLLPDFGEGWSDGPDSAVRDLSPDESSYSVRRVMWRIRHKPQGTCYLKVWLRTAFTPSGGGETVYADLAPYEWNGTGNPCIANSALGVNHPSNAIFGSGNSLSEPASNGSLGIQILKWTCVRGHDGNGVFPTPE